MSHNYVTASAIAQRIEKTSNEKYIFEHGDWALLFRFASFLFFRRYVMFQKIIWSKTK